MLKVSLPTGTKVIFGQNRLTIQPSSFDYGMTEGLCGNFNGDNTDDKYIRDSDEQDQGEPSHWEGYTQYHDFQESWRYVFLKKIYICLFVYSWPLVMVHKCLIKH